MMKKEKKDVKEEVKQEEKKETKYYDYDLSEMTPEEIAEDFMYQTEMDEDEELTADTEDGEWELVGTITADTTEEEKKEILKRVTEGLED